MNCQPIVLYYSSTLAIYSWILFFIAILSIVGTAIALILFNQLIALTSVLFSSSVTYLIPIVAMLIGVSFGESITLTQVASMLVILSGVFVANVVGKK